MARALRDPFIHAEVDPFHGCCQCLQGRWWLRVWVRPGPTWSGGKGQMGSCQERSGGDRSEGTWLGHVGSIAGLARWERMLLERTAAELGHGCPMFSPAPWSAPMSTSCRSWARCGLSTGPRWSSCTGATRSSRRPWPCSQAAAPASVAAPKPDLPSCMACTCVFFTWRTCWWELFLLFAVVLWVLKYIQGPQLTLLKYSKKDRINPGHSHVLRQNTLTCFKTDC